jgi:hypothetical protein
LKPGVPGRYEQRRKTMKTRTPYRPTVALKPPSGRLSIPSPGSFLSIPSAFPGADEKVKNVIKLGFTTSFSQDTEEKIKVEVLTDVVLLDFGAIVPEALDASKIIRDCDLVKQAVTKHPDALTEIVKELQTGTTEGVQRANMIARKASLTEEDALKAGGGLFFLVVVAAALLAGGCGGALKEKATSPAATTTPKQP